VFVSAWAFERLARAHRADLGGVVYAGVGAGIVVAGGACLIALRVHATSAEAWQLLGALAFAGTALIWPVLATERHGRAPVAPSPPDSPASRSALRRLPLCYGAFGFGYIVPATFLPLMAKEVIADPRSFGWAWPLFGAAALGSTLLAARLRPSLSHRAVWSGGQLVMAVGVVVPLVVTGLAGILASALLVGGTFMVITMAGLQEAHRVAGGHGRRLIAAMTAAFGLGQLLGPVMVSVLAPATGALAPILASAAALLVGSAVLLQFTGGKEERA